MNDTDQQVIAYELANNVENPSISGVEGGGGAICSTYGISAYPSVILIAPNYDIVEQDIWPIASMQVIIDAIEPYGPQTSDCDITPSEETEILTYSIPDQMGEATIIDGAVDIIVPVGTDLTAIVPSFTISEGATAYIDDVEQISGTSVIDFSSGSANYEIVAEDEITSQTWTVTVDYNPNPSDETEILTFSFPEQMEEATITNGEVSIIVPVGTDLTSIVPEFTISAWAKAYVDNVEQISGTSTVDFSSGSVDYEIVAEDQTTSQTWTVTIEDNAGISSIEGGNQFAFPNPASDYINLNNNKGANVKILNIMGKVVFEAMDADANLKIDLTNIANGTYIIQQYDDGKIYMGKISVQK